MKASLEKWIMPLLIVMCKKPFYFKPFECVVLNTNESHFWEFTLLISFSAVTFPGLAFPSESNDFARFPSHLGSTLIKLLVKWQLQLPLIVKRVHRIN